MNVKETIRLMESEQAGKLLGALYGEQAVGEQVKRYQDLLAGFEKTFGEHKDVLLFSSPGRTEISGNHTDHNHGKVLAGSINLDCVGVAAKNNSSQVRIVSETYNQDFTIDLNQLEPSPKLAGTVDLVKGLLRGFE
ncbi:MAG: galactokinase family protein, partial [Clostridium sp.]|nr:galactokinase family protein [Clostridium sp.]